MCSQEASAGDVRSSNINLFVRNPDAAAAMAAAGAAGAAAAGAAGGAGAGGPLLGSGYAAASMRLPTLPVRRGSGVHWYTVVECAVNTHAAYILSRVGPYS